MPVEFVSDLPPPDPKRKGKFDLKLQELRSQPGVWALLEVYDKATTAYATANYLRRKHPEFEFAGRRNEVYGRYMPLTRDRE